MQVSIHINPNDHVLVSVAEGGALLHTYDGHDIWLSVAQLRSIVAQAGAIAEPAQLIKVGAWVTSYPGWTDGTSRQYVRRIARLDEDSVWFDRFDILGSESNSVEADATHDWPLRLNPLTAVNHTPVEDRA